MKKDEIKQVILIRRDLKMRRGKEIAQGSHASMMFLVNQERSWWRRVCEYFFGKKLNLTPAAEAWLSGSHTKVCLQVDSEAELLLLHAKALALGLTSHLVTDAGKTEFMGVPTLTAAGIGPDNAGLINQVTGHLKLY